MIFIILTIFCTLAAYCDENPGSAVPDILHEQDEAMKKEINEEDWPQLLERANLGLVKYPDDETYLKIKADAYWNMNKFDKAIEIYNQILMQNPTERYMADLEELETYREEYHYLNNMLEAINSNKWDIKDILPLYLNIMYMQQRISKSYRLVKRFGLQDMALSQSENEDLFLLDEHSLPAAERQEKKREFDNDETLIKLKQANAYQMKRKNAQAKDIYDEILTIEPENIEAKMGIGYLKLHEHDFEGARQIFNEIYDEHPDYTNAKIALSNSYTANAQYLSALEVLDGLPQTSKTAYLRALIYEEAGMYDSSRDAIQNDRAVRSDELREVLYKKQSLLLVPNFAVLVQTLADRYKLDSEKTGFFLQHGLAKNTFGLFSYTGITFSSGRIDTTRRHSGANDINFTITGRPKRRLEFQTNLGARIFNRGNDGSPPGSMLITDSWVKYYLSDRIDLQAGFLRQNLEDSFLSAVGAFVEPNLFAGRVSDNKLYFGLNSRLCCRSYAYLIGSVGMREGENVTRNYYFDSLFGVGKMIYSNPENQFINMIAVDIATYNMGFRHNVLYEFGTDALFGLYYSPPFFDATSLNVRAEGYNSRMRMRYGVKAFVAGQVSSGARLDNRIGAFVVPYISYALGKRFTLNALFHYSNFANVQKFYAMIQLQISLFRKNK